MRILLVEDEEALRITLAANLELEGHSVLEATDGRQALQLLQGNRVDLVLSDIRMPNLGGVGVLQFVKRNFPTIPVVLMTAYTVEEQVKVAISEGVFTVLKKPFDLDSVALALERAARGPIVLIVEDDREDANTLSERLLLCGVKVTRVLDGEQALKAVRDGFVDVCVVDLTTSGMESATLVARLREVDSALTLIVLSGNDTREVIGRASAVGIWAWMKKPIDPGELLLEVAKARGGQWS